MMPDRNINENGHHCGRANERIPLMKRAAAPEVAG